MGKRFEDTLMFDKSWFRKMSTTNKCFYEFLLKKCDAVGIWDVDFELASFHIGDKVDGEGFLKIVNNGKERVRPILEGKKWLLVNFISYQYNELSVNCKPHQHVISLIKKYSLMEELGNSYITIKDKDKDKDKDIRGVQGGKTKLFPIPGKSCRVKDCKLPAIYKAKGAEYDSYLCAEHMPDEVKAKYTG